MKTSRIALLVGGALLAAGAVALPVLAQPGPAAHHGPGRSGSGFAVGEAFARADANNDGQVSRDEGWTWVQARFAEVDTNRDGGITIEEARAYAEARMGGRAPRPEMRQGAEQRGQAMFRALDVNADGKVTLDEIRPFAEAMFRARDTNSDGQLSRSEVMPQRAAFHRHGPGGDRRGPPPAPPAAQPPAPQSN